MSENHEIITADQPMVMSPTGSTSQDAPLSPSTSKPIQELPGVSPQHKPSAIDQTHRFE